MHRNLANTKRRVNTQRGKSENEETDHDGSLNPFKGRTKEMLEAFIINESLSLRLGEKSCMAE